jgi:hypothetical protein
MLVSWLSVVFMFMSNSVATPPPPSITVGGLFDSFLIESANLQLVRQEAGSQYVAAFVMAVDEINDKLDGTRDNFLPHTHLKMAALPGLDFFPTYPPNNFFQGAAKAFTIRDRDSTIKLTIGVFWYLTITT